MEPLSTNIQSLKHTQHTYSYLRTRMMLLILTLHITQYIHEAQSKYDLNTQQRSAINRFFVTHKYSCNLECKYVNSIEMQLLWFIRTQLNIDL